MKKIIAIMLIISMVFTSHSFFVFANGVENIISTTATSDDEKVELAQKYLSSNDGENDSDAKNSKTTEVEASTTDDSESEIVGYAKSSDAKLENADEENTSDDDSADESSKNLEEEAEEELEHEQETEAEADTESKTKNDLENDESDSKNSEVDTELDSETNSKESIKAEIETNESTDAIDIEETSESNKTTTDDSNETAAKSESNDTSNTSETAEISDKNSADINVETATTDSIISTESNVISDDIEHSISSVSETDALYEDTVNVATATNTLLGAGRECVLTREKMDALKNYYPGNNTDTRIQNAKQLIFQKGGTIPTDYDTKFSVGSDTGGDGNLYAYSKDWDTCIIYIPEDATLYLPEDATELFVGHLGKIRNITGLENIDISRCSNMTKMFYSLGRYKTTGVVGDPFGCKTIELPTTWNWKDGVNVDGFFGAIGNRTDAIYLGSYNGDMAMGFGGSKVIYDQGINVYGERVNIVSYVDGLTFGSMELRYIFVDDDFTPCTTKGNSPLFGYLNNLTGGKGSTYATYGDGLQYAKIDEGETSPGYYTKISDRVIIHFDANYEGAAAVDDLWGVKGLARPLHKAGKYNSAPLQPKNGKGYEIKCWNTEPDGTGTSYDVDSATFDVSEITLYAIWKPIDYTIELISNYGETDREDVTIDKRLTYDKPEIIDNPGFTKDGYHINGWTSWYFGKFYDILNPISNLGGESNYDIPERNLVYKWEKLNASWTPNKYYATFIKGDERATGEMENQTLTYNTSETLDTLNYTLKGHTFVGWATKSDGNVAYTNGETKIFNLTKASGSTVPLYAKWNANNYTIKFNSNGATSGTAPTSIAATYDETYTISACDLVKDGYVFKGWSTNSNVVVADYEKEGEISNLAESGEVTLYAVWQEYVNIYYNGGAGSGDMTSDYVPKGIEYTIKGSTYTPATGYKFKNWQVNGADYLDTTITPTSDITFTATYKPITYTITYNPNGATTGEAYTQELEYDKADQKTLANRFTKTNYEFVGWSRTATATTKEYSEDEVLPNLTSKEENVNFYAIWSKLPTYNITYDLNGGIGEGISNTTVIKGEDGTVTTITPTKTGYTFTHFIRSDNDAELSVGNSITNINSDITLKAEYDAITYTVTYHSNGGATEDGFDTIVESFTYDETSSLSANTFIKNNLTFLGWSEAEGSNVIKYTDSYSKTGGLNLKSVQDENVDLYAVWGIKITFDGNGASNTMQAQNFYENTPQKINANTFVKAGYKFTSWSASNGDTYTDKQEITPTENLTLTAEWTLKQKFTITFDANGGTGSMEAVTVLEEDPYTLPSNGFSPHSSRFSFLGWSETKSSSDMKKAGEVITPTGNMTFYAMWKDSRGSNSSDNYSGVDGGSSGGSSGGIGGGGGGGAGGGAGAGGLAADINKVIAANLQVPYVKRKGQWVFDGTTNSWMFNITENKLEAGQTAEFNSLLVSAMANSTLDATTLATQLYEKSTDYVGFAMNGWYHIPYEGNDCAWYYFDALGHMQTGFKEAYGAKYYLCTDAADIKYGSMSFGVTNINNAIYYFNSNGRLYISGTNMDGNVINSDGMVVGNIQMLKAQGITTTINSKGEVEVLNLTSLPTEYIDPIYLAAVLAAEAAKNAAATA